MRAAARFLTENHTSCAWVKWWRDSRSVNAFITRGFCNNVCMCWHEYWCDCLRVLNVSGLVVLRVLLLLLLFRAGSGILSNATALVSTIANEAFAVGWRAFSATLSCLWQNCTCFAVLWADFCVAVSFLHCTVNERLLLSCIWNATRNKVQRCPRTFTNEMRNCHACPNSTKCAGNFLLLTQARHISSLNRLCG